MEATLHGQNKRTNVPFFFPPIFSLRVLQLRAGGEQGKELSHARPSNALSMDQPLSLSPVRCKPITSPLPPPLSLSRCIRSVRGGKIEKSVDTRSSSLFPGRVSILKSVGEKKGERRTHLLPRSIKETEETGMAGNRSRWPNLRHPILSPPGLNRYEDPENR